MSVTSETHSIVIVDDVPEIREILGFLLEESGWFRVVGEAGDGETAIDVVVATRPDLVLLDIELPGMSGWDVLPVLRERVPECPVIVLSGTRAEVGPERAQLAALAGAVLEKGISNRKLINTMLRVLGGDGAEPGAGSTKTSRTPPTSAAAATATNAAEWIDATLAATPDAVVCTSPDGTVLAWNAEAERLYGYTASEIIGRPVRWLFPGERPDEDAFRATILSGRRVEGAESVRVHKDGSRIDVQLSGAPVFDAGGNVVGMVAFARNQSSRRQAEETLARAMMQLEHRNRELSRSNEELDSFAAVASHDLAQPLQVAYGFLDMLRTDYGAALPEKGQEWLNRSVDSLDRMRNLVRDILRYARSGSGEPKLEPTPLDAIIEQATASLEVALTERHATLSIAPDLPVVLGDHHQLALVFQNLIANAIKFVPEERAPVVAVTAEEVDGSVVVRVSDNGIGIAADQRATVFDMFQRAAGSSGYRGTGLGLAIVKKIVGRHGGSVWIDDDERIDGAPGTIIALRLSAPRSQPVTPRIGV